MQTTAKAVLIAIVFTILALFLYDWAAHAQFVDPKYDPNPQAENAPLVPIVPPKVAPSAPQTTAPAQFPGRPADPQYIHGDLASWNFDPSVHVDLPANCRLVSEGSLRCFVVGSEADPTMYLSVSIYAPSTESSRLSQQHLYEVSKNPRDKAARMANFKNSVLEYLLGSGFEDIDAGAMTLELSGFGGRDGLNAFLAVVSAKAGTEHTPVVVAVMETWNRGRIGQFVFVDADNGSHLKDIFASMKPL